MSKIHYFQRYSTAENVVTNNTMQLMARIYEYSPFAASRLLSELVGDAVDIGVEITQQTRGRLSIPDAQIVQRSFRLIIETKVSSGWDNDQLLNHAGSFKNEEQKILILLSKASDRGREKLLQEEIRERFGDVYFKVITFEMLCDAIKELFEEHETSMITLMGDYLEYCNDSSLIEQTDNLMRVVPCGQSAPVNLRNMIYFQPANRNYSKHRYIGIYKDKCVRAIMRVESIVDAELVDGKLTPRLVEGNLTSESNDVILRTIADAKDECGYDLSTGIRFFLGPMESTEFKKTSFGGIQGPRFINLRDHLRVVGSLTEMAEILRSKEWQ